jgi:hypothetical protein
MAYRRGIWLPAENRDSDPTTPQSHQYTVWMLPDGFNHQVTIPTGEDPDTNDDIRRGRDSVNSQMVSQPNIILPSVANDEEVVPLTIRPIVHRDSQQSFDYKRLPDPAFYGDLLSTSSRNSISISMRSLTAQVEATTSTIWSSSGSAAIAARLSRQRWP